jgi:hypothetical protein
MEKTVVMGFLGSVMDVGRGNGRWEKRENLDRHHLLLTLGGGYELYTDDHHRLDLIGGLCYFDIDMDLYMALDSLGSGQSRTVSESPTSWNGIVGLKGRTSLLHRCWCR